MRHATSKHDGLGRLMGETPWPNLSAPWVLKHKSRINQYRVYMVAELSKIPGSEK